MILFDNINGNAISETFIFPGGSRPLIVRADDFGGGEISLELATSADLIPRFSAIASFTENGTTKIDSTKQGLKYRAVLSNAINPVNVYVEMVGFGIPLGFEPSNIPDLKLWLDGDLSPTTIGGAPNQISQWNDISGNENHATQPTSSEQPFTGLNTINGKNVITFSTDNLILPTATTLGIVNVDFEMFFIARSSSAAIQFLISGTTTENYELHLNLSPFGNAGLRFISVTGKFSDIGNDDDFSIGVAHILGGRVDNNVGIARADRIDATDTETPARSADTGILRLGIRTDGLSRHLFGDIALALLWNRALTTSERPKVENYLNLNWGV